MKTATSDQSGFSLLEIMMVLVITGILLSIAVPSFISQKKEFKRTVVSIETLLKTVNLTARANSGNPYRITLSNNANGDYLKVEFLSNGDCRTNFVQNAQGQGWQRDPRKDVPLPSSITVTNFPAVDSTAETNGICFDGRGETNGGAQSFTVTDTQQVNNAVQVVINISRVGDISHVAKDRSGATIPNNTAMPGSELN